jgi:hypothetical protein
MMLGGRGFMLVPVRALAIAALAGCTVTQNLGDSSGSSADAASDSASRGSSGASGMSAVGSGTGTGANSGAGTGTFSEGGTSGAAEAGNGTGSEASDEADANMSAADAPEDVQEAATGTREAGDNNTSDAAAVVGTLCSTCPSGTTLNAFGRCQQTNYDYPGCADGCSTPNAIPACSAQGMCVIASCRPGFADCDGNVSNGCETDLSNPATCGSCTTVCGGTQVCAPSACAATCPIGLTNCNGSCADLTSSGLHCGGCGGTCPPGDSFGSRTCQGGKCGIACDPGFTNCAGACLDTDRDPGACGSCTACAPINNKILTCSSGLCGSQCPFGWTDCGNFCAVLSADPSNCGACGSPCAADDTCQAGQCVPVASLVLAPGSAPQGITVDGNNVFFTDPGNGTVNAVSTDGGVVTTLATNQGQPRRLVGDGAYVYWSNYLGGVIMRTLESGAGTPSVLSAASEPLGIAVDAANVYWVDLGTGLIKSAPKEGGASVTVVSQGQTAGQPSELVLAGGALYFSTFTGMPQRFPFPSGPLTDLLTSEDVDAYDFAASGSYVYWASFTQFAWYSLASGNIGFNDVGNAFEGEYDPTLSADACGAYTWDVLSSGQTNIPGVWLLAHTSDTAFGGLAPVAIGVKGGGPPRLATSGRYVFWANPGGSASVAGVYRALKPE